MIIRAYGHSTTETMAAEDADEMVCLRTPPFFAAVGQFYTQFEPVEDEEVLEVLKEERERKGDNKIFSGGTAS